MKKRNCHNIAAQAVANSLIQVEGLSKSFGGQTVLDDLSVTLHQGEVVLLRGNNGSGKTTLLNILTGNLKPDAGAIQFSINGHATHFSFIKKQWLSLTNNKEFSPEFLSSRGIGRTWQDIRLFQNLSLQENITVATPNQLGENPVMVLMHPNRVKAQEQMLRSEAKKYLYELGLKGREQSHADDISLGQSKRVAIARTLQAKASILFLDEPLAGLDERGIAEIMAYLKLLADRHNVTLVIIEHEFNLPGLLQLATTIWTLHRGKIAVQAASSDCIATLFNAEKTKGYWVEHHVFPNSPKNKKKSRSYIGANFTILTDRESGVDCSPVLEIKNLVIYRDKQLIIGQRLNNGSVEGLSLKICKGEVGIFQASNGWGKTTLLEAIAGLIPISQGSIKLNGYHIEKRTPWERANKGLAYLQARNNVFPNLRVKEACQLAGIHDLPKEIQAFENMYCSELSGGEKQKIALVTTLSNLSYSLALLDEPFTALDASGQEFIGGMLRDIIKQSGIIIALPSCQL